MKPRRLNRRGEAARVEKRRGSTTVTTKWVDQQKTEQDLQPFVPTIPLRYRKDHVMFHFDDEARIGVSKRELEEEEKREQEKKEKEERERQKREKEKEEREHYKKKEELRMWIQKEEEEKQKALGRAVLEWHKEVQRWGRARQEKGELLKGLRRSSDLENEVDESKKEKGDKPCTCLPAGQGEPVIEEGAESYVDSLEPGLDRDMKEKSPGELLHSPGNLLAHYVKEAAKEQPHLFRESRMEPAPSTGNSQADYFEKPRQRKGSVSSLMESPRGSREKSRRTSHPGRALHSSILAWREGVERSSRGGTASSRPSGISSRAQPPTTSSFGLQVRARGERARSHDHVNFGKITTSINSPWVLRPGSLMLAPKTWPPGRRGSPSRGQWRDLEERDALFRSLSDPELAKVFDGSSSSQGSTSAGASFNWSLRVKGEESPQMPSPGFSEKSMKQLKFGKLKTSKEKDKNTMQQFSRTRGNPETISRRVTNEQLRVLEHKERVLLDPEKRSGVRVDSLEREKGRDDLEEREREEAVYDYLPHTLELSARLRHI